MDTAPLEERLKPRRIRDYSDAELCWLAGRFDLLAGYDLHTKRWHNFFISDGTKALLTGVNDERVEGPLSLRDVVFDSRTDEAERLVEMLRAVHGRDDYQDGKGPHPCHIDDLKRAIRLDRNHGLAVQSHGRGAEIGGQFEFGPLDGLVNRERL